MTQMEKGGVKKKIILFFFYSLNVAVLNIKNTFQMF